MDFTGKKNHIHPDLFLTLLLITTYTTTYTTLVHPYHFESRPESHGKKNCIHVYKCVNYDSQQFHKLL